MTYKEETNIGAHAILVETNGDVLLQQRDYKQGIINPGLISMFGGTLRKNETPHHALMREVKEELQIDTSEYKTRKIGAYQKTRKQDGIDYTIHVFSVHDININNLILHEGESIYRTSVEEALANSKLTRITKLALADYFKSGLQ